MHARSIQMTRAGLVAVVVAALAGVGCQVEIRAFQPFARTTWQTLPSDAEIVDAVRGTGGLIAEQELLRAVMAEVLVPELHRQVGGDVRGLERWVGVLASQHPQTPRALAAIVIRDRVAELAARATTCAERRLHDDLWPTDRYPFGWDRDLAVTCDHPATAATQLALELAALERRWGADLVAHDEAYYVAANAIHIARTGDHAVAAHVLYNGLAQRGVAAAHDAAADGRW